MTTAPTSSPPVARGRFGPYGGQYVPETIMPALDELEAGFRAAIGDVAFQAELDRLLKTYVGRPTPLYAATRLAARIGSGAVWLKREDLAHTGAHKINNAVGQGLLAQRMGKQRIIAETGAGQHGVATATVCAMLGLECVVYMGEEDIHRQALNVYRMRLLGADVRSVTSGSRTLKDAINEAIRDWITNVKTTYYLLGSAVGPHPYPVMVRDFQSVIGNEIKSQMKEIEKKIPDALIACVGGGSNAIGTFYPLLDEDTEMFGIEAGGEGIETDYHSATLNAGSKGVLHGMLTYLLQDREGQILDTHSVAAGLDYPGVGPEHSYLKDSKRVKYDSVSDQNAVDAFLMLAKYEGIIPALESSHAVAYAIKIAKKFSKSDSSVITL